jgi:hypothetical protein
MTTRATVTAMQLSFHGASTDPRLCLTHDGFSKRLGRLAQGASAVICNFVGSRQEALQGSDPPGFKLQWVSAPLKRRSTVR